MYFLNTKNVEKLVDITDLNLLLSLEMLMNILHQVYWYGNMGTCKECLEGSMLEPAKFQNVVL